MTRDEKGTIVKASTSPLGDGDDFTVTWDGPEPAAPEPTGGSGTDRWA
jgi:hypothetical protein